ncbi:MAG: hypothetical protein U9P14_02055 [Gemmatimonadota bacterium]|nr:hypothetical protein [Gemmatimonadota bacterium]
MKMVKSITLSLCLILFLSVSTVLGAGEIGFFAGGYSKDSDISSVNIGSLTSGDRSWATCLGFTWGNPDFIIPLFELEHTVAVAFGADKSSKPNTFLYSATFNIILPVDLVRIKPFLGAGLGWAYNFGSKNVVAGAGDVAGLLGNNSNFMLNLGGGTKIKVSEKWWMRLTLRDYILLNMERAVIGVAQGGTVLSTVKESTHNLAFNVGLAYEY